jgi:lipid A disaccharide synthetase
MQEAGLLPNKTHHNPKVHFLVNLIMDEEVSELIQEDFNTKNIKKRIT